MPNYVTALQVWGQSWDATTFTSGGQRVQSPRPMSLHAVRWPDPLGRGWDQLETMCGKVTGEYNMKRAPVGATADWPPEGEPGTVCQTCKSNARASA